MQENYKNYFKNTYKSTFATKDTSTQSKFLYKQYLIIKNKINIGERKGGAVLEIGSGLGAFAKILLDNSFGNYTGIELDKKAVEFTNSTIGDYFENISLEMFNEKSKKKYKTIFAFEVLEHLYNPQDGIKQIKDLLDEDGIFIGTSPFPFKKNVLADKTHRFCLHPENWKKFFLENGFKKVEIYPMSFIPFVWRINKHLNIRLPFYISIKHFISTTLIIAKK